VVSVESQNNVWVTKVTVIRIENRISEESATVSGALGSVCGFVTNDRLAVVLSDRLMVFKTDATVTGEKLFEGATPTRIAIGRGSIAILSRSDGDLAENTLTVYDRNARESYRLDLDSGHPIRQAGSVTAMAFGESTLFMRAGDTLLRISGNGNTVTSAAVSRDTLAILPLDSDEVLVCTPAYAYRLEDRDFVRP
jgi:hypothetical protein